MYKYLITYRANLHPTMYEQHCSGLSAELERFETEPLDNAARAVVELNSAIHGTAIRHQVVLGCVGGLLICFQVRF